MRPDQVRTEVGRAVNDPRATRNIGLLGDYRLGKRLDDGGTNEVYEATAPGNAGKVVIKFLRRAVAAGPRATEACRQERALVGSLHHPNIAALLALGTTPDGVPYVVREHFEAPRSRATWPDAVRCSRWRRRSWSSASPCRWPPPTAPACSTASCARARSSSPRRLGFPGPLIRSSTSVCGAWLATGKGPAPRPTPPG